MLPADAPARADYRLAAVALAIGGGFTIGVVSGAPLVTAGAAGSALAGVVIADGLVRPP